MIVFGRIFIVLNTLVRYMTDLLTHMCNTIYYIHLLIHTKTLF